MCSFSLTSPSCASCRSFADCLDETAPLLVPEREPRTDAPLKVIVRHCRTRRSRRDYR